MATLTIRNLPDEVVDRIKTAATHQGRSMEQEVRDVLLRRYASRNEVVRRIRQRWEGLPATAASDVKRWRKANRR
jgi:plasmid stability protein